MAGNLKNMQDTVAKYAQVLSKVLKVDVEIVDSELNRIAGTGMFEGRVDKNMGEEGYVYKEVIRTGKKHIIKNPGSHEICIHCPKQENCEETFEMSMPIKIREKVIGVIGFVCFSQEQREHILYNYNTFAEFLEQISELIASKAKEEMEKENLLNLVDMLNNIIDKVEQGVIIVNEKGVVSRANSIAKKILNLNTETKPRIRINPTDNSIFNMKEYELVTREKTYVLAGEEYNILGSNFEYNKVFLFTDINSLKHRIFSVTNTKENVGLDHIIGESSLVRTLKERVKKTAPSSSTILIHGESGTGKEMFARAIHMESNRSNNPFVTINCAAVPDTLLESELFGYVKGAFTGADPKGKIGKVEFANKGTLFLDEIGDMPLYLQAKLLRVLQQREIIRLGSNKPISVDVRIIAATNKNLEQLINEGTFREDLYYRLNVIPFSIPPLRERKEDIRVLTDYFIVKYTTLFKKKVLGVERNVWDYLHKYDWPGNVRELENTIEYMINMLDNNGVINTRLLPQKIRNDTNRNDVLFSLQKTEKDLIKRALDMYGKSLTGKQQAADALGIGIATLYRKIKKYELE